MSKSKEAATRQFTIREVRRGDAAGIARVHAAAWKTTYRGIIPAAVLEGMSEETGTPRFEQRINEYFADPTWPFLVATDNDRLLGFARGTAPEDYPPGFDCEIKAIYVDPDYQGRGIGQHLVSGCVRRFLDRNCNAMIIWAAAENPWCRFYDKLGGRVLEVTKAPEIGSKPVAHVAYGWTDLAKLIAS